jgi:hypothetical protein
MSSQPTPYHRPLHKGAIYTPNTTGRYWNRPIQLEPPAPWKGIALMPLRIIVAAFLWIEATTTPNIDPERFGYMFRSRRTA